MNEVGESKTDGFLSASELLQVKGVGKIAWDDWQQSEITLPKTGKKYFEPNGSWLQDMQLENGLKNRKRLLEIERVDRSSQLAIAEWLPGSQKARVTKKSGQKWENFGYEDKSQLYLLPEEALILLEMNCLELSWNGMPLSVQQAYEVLINTENSKCTLDEYRVYSQLVRWGYKLQRFRDKSSVDSKSTNITKRIIMNPDGLWTPNTSPTIEKQIDSNGSSSKTNSEQEDDTTVSKDRLDNDKSPKAQRIGIVSEETVLGSIKIIKTSTSPTKDIFSSQNQVSKWPGSRIQRNVKLMPKRNDKGNNAANSELGDECTPNFVPEKRRNSDSLENTPKKPRPEVIELSDDEIEEIPRPMTRMEILNTLPNLADGRNDTIVAEIPKAYIPHNIKPIKDIYRYDRNRLLNLSQTDTMLKSNMQVVPVNNGHNRPDSHYYAQRSQCQAIATYGSNNGYSFRGMRCQRDSGSYIQQNVSHNTIHTPYSGTVYQSNYVNFVMEVMGNMVRSFRQQQFQQTTFCQNVLFSPRLPYQQQRYQPYINYYANPMREQYSRRGGGGGGGGGGGVGMSGMTTLQRGRGYQRYGGNDAHRATQEEPSQPSFSKRPGVSSWSELKQKWREESTITIEDEEPTQTDVAMDNSEVQVVEESISPLISSKSGISNLSEVYERLSVIKSAIDRTVRSRKVNYSLSYEVYPISQHYRKSSPGTPMCRLFIINSKKDFYMDTSKLQRLQQESKEVPVVVAFVSQSCISYIQPGVVLLPNLS